MEGDQRAVAELALFTDGIEPVAWSMAVGLRAVLRSAPTANPSTRRMGRLSSQTRQDGTKSVWLNEPVLEVCILSPHARTSAPGRGDGERVRQDHSSLVSAAVVVRKRGLSGGNQHRAAGRHHGLGLDDALTIATIDIGEIGGSEDRWGAPINRQPGYVNA